jgi:hypothetical protein
MNKAYYISEQTGKDGKFVLQVSDGGTYYLRVRGAYGGGEPQEGEIVNLNAPRDLIPVTVKKGEKVSGVKLPIMHLSQRGPLYKGKEK